LLRDTEENHEKSQSGNPKSRPEFEPGSLWVHLSSVTASVNFVYVKGVTEEFYLLGYNAV
jgi:hypothetical protein